MSEVITGSNGREITFTPVQFGETVIWKASAVITSTSFARNKKSQTWDTVFAAVGETRKEALVKLLDKLITAQVEV